MQVNVNKLSPVLMEFDVEIASDKVKSELNKAYNSLAKSARIRGFRKGKAPRKVLKHMFGASVAQDVAQRLVDETFPEAVSSQSVQPVSAPAIEPQKLKDNAPFTYKARFEVVPEIESVAYDGLEAKKPSTKVEDAAIQEELEKFQRAHSTLEEPKKPRGAKENDTATIDFVVEVDGDEVSDAGASGFQVELGSGTLLPAIEEAITGKKPGESAEAEVEMPDAHPHPGLAGNKCVFKISVTDLKERVLPDIDDEFAKDVGEEFETLDDLKKHIVELLEKQQAEAVENAVAEQLVAALCQANPIPVPPSLVQRQAQITEQEILAQARRQGQQGELGDEMRNRVQADSEVKVRAGLLMAEIAKVEGIKIGDEEIEEGLKELADQTGKNVAKLRAEYRDQKKREMLIGMILENKVLDIIEAKAKIEDAE